MTQDVIFELTAGAFVHQSSDSSFESQGGQNMVAVVIACMPRASAQRSEGGTGQRMQSFTFVVGYRS